MPKHVPGPWKVWKFVRSDNPESIRQEIGTVVEGTPICQLTGNEDNARLIAMAPELLDTLEEALNIMDAETFGKPGQGREKWERFSRVLKKAKG